MKVSSPTSRGSQDRLLAPLVRSLLVVVLSAMLTAGQVGLARAESLTDAHDRVQRELGQARKRASSDKNSLSEAKQRLAASVAQLATARSKLAAVRSQLAEARKQDARVADELKEAEAASAAAAARVATAEDEVARQRALVGIVVRSAYQQQSDLVAFTMLVTSTSAAELAQRYQWSTTILNSSTGQLERLNFVERQLQTIKSERLAAEAEVARKRAAAAAQLAKIKDLDRQASEREAEVAALVAVNTKAKGRAQEAYQESRADYEALELEEAQIAAKLRGEDYPIYNVAGFIRPVNAAAGSPFGMRFHPILKYWRMHWGTDFGASCGTPIRAMANGRVVSAGWTSSGFGYYTIINYGRMLGANMASGYAHQSRIVVRAGDTVKQGEIVGYVGTTGLSTGCHLHLQIYRDGARVDPMRYL